MPSARFYVAIALAFATFNAAGGSEPGAGIRGTAHDFSSVVTSPATGGMAVLQWVDANGAITTRNSGIPHIDPATGNQGVAYMAIGLCVTCHSIAAAASVHLVWNPALRPAPYAWDEPETTAGTPYPPYEADSFKGPTAKCLTCHDGFLAGSDGTWFDREAFAGTGLVDAPKWAAKHYNVASPAENVSATLPIAMPYPHDNEASSYNLMRNGDIDPAAWVADPGLEGIRLYNDDGAGNVRGGAVPRRTGIECSSCHDVHNRHGVRDVHLLTFRIQRTDRSGGDICLLCHLK